MLFRAIWSTRRIVENGLESASEVHGFAGNLWPRCASFCGATGTNKPGSVGRRGRRLDGLRSCERSAMFGVSHGKNSCILAAAAHARLVFYLAEAVGD